MCMSLLITRKEQAVLNNRASATNEKRKNLYGEKLPSKF